MLLQHQIQRQKLSAARSAGCSFIRRTVAGPGFLPGTRSRWLLISCRSSQGTTSCQRSRTRFRRPRAPQARSGLRFYLPCSTAKLAASLRHTPRRRAFLAQWKSGAAPLSVPVRSAIARASMNRVTSRNDSANVPPIGCQRRSSSSSLAASPSRWPHRYYENKTTPGTLSQRPCYSAAEVVLAAKIPLPTGPPKLDQATELYVVFDDERGLLRVSNKNFPC